MKITYVIIATIGLLLVISLAVLYLKPFEKSTINDFESCVAAGYPVLESYPEICKMPDGTNYVKVIKKTFNYSEGLILMRNKENFQYACFGCNNVMCVDPAPIMEIFNESEQIYCDDEFNVVRLEGIKIKDNFGTKIVYEPSEWYALSDYEKDCQTKGGEFNSCGDICAPNAEICVKMCGFTCENIN